jgi:hypothetical protein
LTEEQVKDLKLMCNPSEWPVANLLALKRYRRDENMMVTEYECGTLVYANMVHRFMFWPGLSFHMPGNEAAKILQRGNSSGPLLAFQLEDLVREGWEVD